MNARLCLFAPIFIRLSLLGACFALSCRPAARNAASDHDSVTSSIHIDERQREDDRFHAAEMARRNRRSDAARESASATSRGAGDSDMTGASTAAIDSQATVAQSYPAPDWRELAPQALEPQALEPREPPSQLATRRSDDVPKARSPRPAGSLGDLLARADRDDPPAAARPLARSTPGCNVIFISIDALQASHAPWHGYPRDTLPRLSEFARRSYRFTNVRSVASWTVPASMSWFTGVYPSEHRMTNKFAVYDARQQRIARLDELSPRLVTLAEQFRRAGYATGGFTGNAGVSGGFGFDIGFETFVFEANRFGGFDDSAPQALEWLRQIGERRYFLFLHGYDCHGQSEPGAKSEWRFVEAAYDGRYRGRPHEQETLREEGLDRGALQLRAEDWRFWRAIYDEKIVRADARVARFLEDAERIGALENTLVVITSDHGTEFGEHGRIDHGFALYDEHIRVPLVIRLPKQSVGRAIAESIGSIDLAPTILDLAGLLSENDRGGMTIQLRGRSLVPTMNGEPPRRDVVSETDYRLYTHKRSLVTPDGWKLIYTLESKSRELYDLNVDPRERRDLSASESDRADELERRLFTHFEAIGCDLRAQSWETGFNPVYNFRPPAPGSRDIPGSGGASSSPGSSRSPR